MVHVSLPPNGILIGSSIFTRLVVVVKRIPSELLLLLESWFRIVNSQRSTASRPTCIRVSSSIVAVVVETRLLPAFGSLVKVAVVVETRLLPVFVSLVKVALVVETWLLPAFGSLVH